MSQRISSMMVGVLLMILTVVVVLVQAGKGAGGDKSSSSSKQTTLSDRWLSSIDGFFRDYCPRTVMRMRDEVVQLVDSSRKRDGKQADQPPPPALAFHFFLQFVWCGRMPDNAVNNFNELVKVLCAPPYNLVVTCNATEHVNQPLNVAPPDNSSRAAKTRSDNDDETEAVDLDDEEDDATREDPPTAPAIIVYLQPKLPTSGTESPACACHDDSPVPTKPPGAFVKQSQVDL
jgi:hypothetical protein